MNSIEVGEDGRYPVLRTAGDEGRQLSDITRSLVLRRDRCRCVFCGRSGRLEVDHIIPWSAGGSDDMDNLRTLCHYCNQDRSNFRVPADDERRIPNGHQCVYCTKYLQGEPDLTPIYCIQCNKKAPGIPNDPTWHPDVDREPFDYEEYADELPKEYVELEQAAAKYRDDAIKTIRLALARAEAPGNDS